MGLFSRKPKDSTTEQIPKIEDVPEPSIHLKLNEIGIEFPVILESFIPQELSIDDELMGVGKVWTKERYNDFFDLSFYKENSKLCEENARSSFSFSLVKDYTEENEREIVHFINTLHKIYGMDYFSSSFEFSSGDLEILRNRDVKPFRIFRQVMSREELESLNSIMYRTNRIGVSLGGGKLYLFVSSPVEFVDKN